MLIKLTVMQKAKKVSEGRPKFLKVASLAEYRSRWQFRVTDEKPYTTVSRLIRRTACRLLSCPLNIQHGR